MQYSPVYRVDGLSSRDRAPTLWKPCPSLRLFFSFSFILVEIVSFLAYFLRGVSRWPGTKIEANQDPPTSQAKGVGEVKGEIWT